MEKYIYQYSKPEYYTYYDLCRNMNDIIYDYNNNTLHVYMDILLSQIQFLSNININKISNTNGIVNILYIGSSKAYHFNILNNLYKNLTNIQWYFYDIIDPCVSVEGRSYNIIYNRKIFSEDDIKLFKDMYPLILIYDYPDTINTRELLYHYNMQNNIILYLMPLYALLKFKYIPNDRWNTYIESNEYISTGIKYLPIIKSLHTRNHVDDKNIITLTFDRNESNNYYEKMHYYNNCSGYKNIYNDISGYILNKSELYDLNTSANKILATYEEEILNNIKYDINFRNQHNRLYNRT
ncbi:poly(A) polymerase small subunit VP39 [Mythimna separata entomopoxvirus 'L']|uniref:Poly(A) polymerase small subunit VP39 n=1 Tax=Mythimna separata entomopoxvirus 'L' TaxID=1293572 RepID=A0A916P7I5_9POXV|nr:poly(A) polymerase small subunit VP39 [Mythimna separata entomopoxvirus 'L']CCU56366.1 poly(A) polymerase small subunit VP39 [Mythimna separata entomopoxvirus 'L']